MCSLAVAVLQGLVGLYFVPTMVSIIPHSTLSGHPPPDVHAGLWGSLSALREPSNSSHYFQMGTFFFLNVANKARKPILDDGPKRWAYLH